MKTNIAGAIIAISCLLTATTAYADDDIQYKFDALKGKSIVSEQRLNDGVTRAELAVVLMRTYLLAPSDKPGPFTDLQNHWLSGTRAAETMLVKGWMTGKSTTRFNPDDPVTKHEFSLILSRAGQAVNQDWTNSDAKITRKELFEVLYDIVQDEQTKLRIVKTKVTAEDSVEVTYSDRKVQTYAIPTLTPGKPTPIDVTYKDRTFSFVALWMGDEVQSVKALKTRLNVHAGEVEKDKLSYQLYNAGGQIVPLPPGAKIVVKSDDPHISADGWFDNKNDPTSTGSRITYTIEVLQGNKVIAADTQDAVVYEEAAGFKPTAIRYLTANNNKTWGYGYITMQNNDVIEPKVRLIVTKAVACLIWEKLRKLRVHSIGDNR